ncbi:hypothetical protein L1987_18153 [Smallanthus sonchifolius]|uniref:Uncharacterized protein n=1 Tax=Smallanthus sonchifolius TaxID=185202 RepID=A0ACB9J0Z1_9ASTR|nr:hypothetical protein L1987_18153 [Smallanthus sonchifolius]
MRWDSISYLIPPEIKRDGGNASSVGMAIGRGWYSPDPIERKPNNPQAHTRAQAQLTQSNPPPPEFTKIATPITEIE